MSEYKSDFVMLAALPKPEFSELKKVIRELKGNWKPVKDDPGVIVGRIGPAPGFRFYAATQSQPGMVSAAALATRMIERYRPQYIAMVGIAAGYDRSFGSRSGASSRLPFGSVLVADSVANYQAGKMTEKGFQRDGTSLPLDDHLKRLFDDHGDEIVGLVNTKIGGVSEVNWKSGPIVAGSQVIASRDVMSGIRNEFRKVVGVEMEGFGVFRAATEAAGPRPRSILIKSICDYGTNVKDDRYQRLASRTSALFFLLFAIRHLKFLPLPASHDSGLELVPLEGQPRRETLRIDHLLDGCKKSSSVRFISITGKSFLDPEGTHQERDPFDKAIRRGVKFRGIVLDPESPEAKFRALVESPGEPASRRLLVRHATSVRRRLAKARGPWRRNLILRHSTLGLPFKLWLFKHVACIEPYHVGKRKDDRKREESALCGFAHIWIARSDPEYEIVEQHFEKLWQQARRSRT